MDGVNLAWMGVLMLLGIEPVHCGSSGILFVPFFCGKGVYVDVVVVF